MSIALLCMLGALLIASASAQAVPQLLTTFDGTATPAGSLSPGRLAVNESSGDLYVLDVGHNVVDRFDATGGYLSQLDGSSTTAGSFDLSGEADVAVDNSGGPTQGNVYVVSEAQSTVFAFDASGAFLWQYSQSWDACGVAVDSSGQVWVSDRLVPTLLAFNPASAPPAHVRTIVPGGTPCQIAFAPGDTLYVNNFQGSVDEYDSGGSYVTTVEGNTSFDVATDSSTGNAFTDEGTQIAAFDSAGAAQPGTPFGSGTVSDSIGVAVNGSSGRIYVTDRTGNQVEVFDRDAPAAPAATTGGTSSVTNTGATLGGTVNPSNDATTCQFEYGTDTSYGSTAACDNDPGAGAGNVDETASISGLAPNTTYHYRLVATNSIDTTNGDDATFTTLPDAPTVTTGAASGVTRTTAHVAGTVNPNEGTTTCHVEYGPTLSYGNVAPCTPAPGSGSIPVDISASMPNLSANTTYHYRVVATNDGGTTNGDDATLTTLPNAPSVGGATALDITATAATLTANVNPNGTAATCRFEYGTTTAYGSIAACATAAGSGTSDVAVSAALSGLHASTVYHYRIVASGPGGAATGSDRAFMTEVTPTAEQGSPATDGTLALPSTAKVKAGKARVAVSCSGDDGATCTGTLTLTARLATKHGTKTVAIGRADYDLGAGEHATLSVSLSKAARKALKQHRLDAAAKGLGGSIRLPKTPAPKHHRKPRHAA